MIQRIQTYLEKAHKITFTQRNYLYTSLRKMSQRYVHVKKVKSFLV